MNSVKATIVRGKVRCFPSDDEKVKGVWQKRKIFAQANHLASKEPDDEKTNLLFCDCGY